jgi:hypothetical protein
MKKQILPVIVLGTLALPFGATMAATLSVTAQTHSVEGIVGVTATQTSNTISETLGATYAVDDRITFVFNSDVITNTTFSSQITVAKVDSATPADAIAGLVLGLLSASGDGVSYRVTSVTQPDDTPGDGGTDYTDKTTVGAVIELGAVTYSVSSLSTGSMGMSVSAETSTGTAIDSAATATLATTSTEFGTVTIGTKFDNVIDVSASRKAFTPVSSDSMNWVITHPDTTGWLNLVTLDSSQGTVVTLHGESGRMAGLKGTNFAVSNGATLVFTESTDTLVMTYDGTTVSTDTVTFTAPTDTDAVTLYTQSFTADVVLNYTTAGGTTGAATLTSGLAAGAWTLNAATVVIPYMPYSSSASQIIYITNTGTQSGDISVKAVESSTKSYDLGVIATTKPGDLTKLSQSILTALTTKGFSSGKLTLILTVDVPLADIIVYTSYNIGGADRGFINTDQYIKN